MELNRSKHRRFSEQKLKSAKKRTEIPDAEHLEMEFYQVYSIS